MRVLTKFLLILASSTPAFAANVPTLETGHYIRDGGTGTLDVEAEKNGARSFSIDTFGANAHSCGLEGEVKGRVARLKDGIAEGECVIDFKSTADGVLVEPRDGSKCNFCGARAHFNGVFRKALPECLDASVEKLRDLALFAYKNKNYTGARDLLMPLVGKCDRYLYLDNQAWLRNDVAINFYKLRDLQACLDVLDPIKDSMEFDDQEYRNMDPAGADSRIKVAKATRHNLKLCRMKH